MGGRDDAKTSYRNFKKVTHMDSNQIKERMIELMKPIDKQIMMCDDNQELLMLACAMLQRTTEIFDDMLTKQGRIKMFQDLVK